MVLAWIAALAAVIVLAPMLAGDSDADFGTKGSESEEVAQLLNEKFDRSGEFVTVAWEGADQPGAKDTIDRFVAEARQVPGIGDAEGARVSPDGTIGVTQLQLTRRGWDVPPETGQALIRLAEQSSTDDVEIAVGGVVIQNAEEGGSPEGIGMMAAAVILLIAFGSIVAAGLPLAVALFGLGISAGLITVLAAFVDVPDFAPAVAGLIGIGVGVDYALLVLTRFRAALETSTPREAIREAVETAGRSRAGRRHHRADQRQRPVPHGRQLPAGRRAGHQPRRARGDGRLGHAAARAAGLRRPQGQPAAHPRPRPRLADQRPHAGRALEPDGAAPPRGSADRRLRARARPQRAGARPQARLPGRRQRPRGHPDPRRPTT